MEYTKQEQEIIQQRAQEFETLLNEINTISKAHQNNDRIQTLKKECLELFNAIRNHKSTERFLLKITTHKGKMQGIRSLSTYKLVCDTCLSLKDNKATICNHCYVDKAFMRYPQLSMAMIYNTLLLKYTKLKDRQLPIINDLYFRFESFSDLQNLQHLQNLYRIARKNPRTQFALWTKNIKLILQEQAPKNVNLILSSPILNECLPMAQSIIDKVKRETNCKHVKVFSVYDDEHIKEQNCAQKCITCLKCYKKQDKTTLINELLK